ncbi:MAG: PAS domain S-box protein [Candidatus Paceibacterota bacterium]
MKKFFLAALIFFQLFSFSSIFAVENDFKTFRVGVYDNAPKIYKDANGTIKGFWADITNAIAKKENWNLVYVYGTWDEGLARLEKGEIDMMVDVAVNEERKAKYDFNNEIALLSWSTIYARKGFNLESFKDLEGKNIAVIKSSVHYTAPLGLKNVLNSFGVSTNIIDVKNMEDVFKLLDANQADAGVVNWHFGILNESKYKVNRTGIFFNPSELNYAFTKNGSKNKYLISVLDFDLREMKDNQNSFYYTSIRVNFGKSLGEIQVWPRWLGGFLIVVGSFLMLIVFILLAMRQYQTNLRREISKKIQEIKESEEKFTTVIDQAQDGIVIVQDKIIKYANRAISMTGYTEKEVLGEPFIKFIVSEDRQRISESYDKGISGEKAEAVYEIKLTHKNGSVVDVEFSSATIQYENKPAILIIIRDATQRKKLEKEIIFRNTILSTELEVAIDGVLVVDEKSKIILYNKKFIEMWGIPQKVIDTKSDKLTIKSILDKLVNPQEFLDHVKYLYGHPGETDRSEILLKDERIFDRYSAPMIDSNQKNYGRVWYFRDISEAKKLEIRLKELDALKSKFIQIVSHQLRTPLSVLRWNLESLLSGTHGHLERATKDILSSSLKANIEIINRIGDLLIALDIEEKRLVYLNKTSVSLEDLLDSVLIGFKTRLEAKNISYSYQAPKKSLPMTELDIDKIRIALEKIIDNAINYSKEKGKIKISLKKIGNRIRFEVADTGIGIPKDEQKNIWVRFFRASNAINMKPDASGIGLFIAKYFIEQHDGEIGFESIKGKGSTFWIDLPILDSQEKKDKVKDS